MVTASRKSARRWASPDQVAEYLGVHPATVRRMVGTGEVPAYKMPGSRLLRIDLDELDSRMRRVPTYQPSGAPGAGGPA